ncbi:MAG: carbohydrate kinase family protein [Phycisphaeraceae bacterium]|nr:carbohydrate kinase family protein [Phycisphaeraceae bacterium]
MADVGCAGILVADTFCGPMRSLPAEGELVTVGDMATKAGGCAVNVAIDLAKQGVSVDIAGCVGRDASAEFLLQSLHHAGVGHQRVVMTDRQPTSRTVILLVEGQDRRYVHHFGANVAFAASDIDRAWAAGLKVFYLGGLFALPGLIAEELRDLLRHCRRAGVVTVLDVVVPQQTPPRQVLDLLLPEVDYFLPNEDEARRLTGLHTPESQAMELGRRGAGTVVITCESHGAVAARGDRLWRCPAHDCDVVDPSGSGDAFAAGLIAGILQHHDMPGMLQYASALGASAIRCVGTTDGVLTAGEARAFIAAHPLHVQCEPLA